jgi:hypothetical protein
MEDALLTSLAPTLTLAVPLPHSQQKQTPNTNAAALDLTCRAPHSQYLTDTPPPTLTLHHLARVHHSQEANFNKAICQVERVKVATPPHLTGGVTNKETLALTRAGANKHGVARASAVSN